MSEKHWQDLTHDERMQARGALMMANWLLHLFGNAKTQEAIGGNGGILMTLLRKGCKKFVAERFGADSSEEYGAFKKSLEQEDSADDAIEKSKEPIS